MSKFFSGALELITGMPAWAWIAIGAFLAGGGAAWKYKGAQLDKLQLEFNHFVSETERLGKESEKARKAENDLHQQTLEGVSNAWFQTLQPTRDQAVARYVAAHPVSVRNPNSGGSQIPGSAGSVQGNDAAGKECMAAQGSTCQPDARFIQDCAEDALKIQTWQDWARGNKLPIKDLAPPSAPSSIDGESKRSE